MHGKECGSTKEEGRNATRGTSFSIGKPHLAIFPFMNQRRNCLILLLVSKIWNSRIVASAEEERMLSRTRDVPHRRANAGSRFTALLMSYIGRKRKR